MIIRYADVKDYLWLKEHDSHISDEVLKSKINSKEIFIVQEDNKIIGWLRFNLFWDHIPFMNMIYFLGEYRNKGFGKKLTNYWEKIIDLFDNPLNLPFFKINNSTNN
jgi:ribosomal protein S18 acetylase RimI-like enzyme